MNEDSNHFNIDLAQKLAEMRVNGDTYQEISSKLDISSGHIYNILETARQMYENGDIAINIQFEHTDDCKNYKRPYEDVPSYITVAQFHALGYNQQRIADFMATSQASISRRLKNLHKYVDNPEIDVQVIVFQHDEGL